MLPPLVSLRCADGPSPIGVNGRARTDTRPQEHLTDIVRQIFEEAVNREENVLIVYNYTGSSEECQTTLYATLKFEELANATTDRYGAAALLRMFKHQLQSIEPNNQEPVNLNLGLNEDSELTGLADLLTDDHWPHGAVGEEVLYMSEGRRHRVLETVEVVDGTIAVNRRRFERNRDALERMMLQPDVYFLDPTIVPYDGSVDEWWETFVYHDVVDGDPDAGPVLVDEDERWATGLDIRVQSLEDWIKNVFKPAKRILMSKLHGANSEIPLFIGRVRVYIEIESE